jgi:hypothetical protein
MNDVGMTATITLTWVSIVIYAVWLVSDMRRRHKALISRRLGLTDAN